MAYNMTIAESFEVAINDGINIYVRDILFKGGYLTEEEMEALGTPEMLQEKYEIAKRLGAAWAKKVADDNIRG